MKTAVASNKRTKVEEVLMHGEVETSKSTTTANKMMRSWQSLTVKQIVAINNVRGQMIEVVDKVEHHKGVETVSNVSNQVTSLEIVPINKMSMKTGVATRDSAETTIKTPSTEATMMVSTAKARLLVAGTIKAQAAVGVTEIREISN